MLSDCIHNFFPLKRTDIDHLQIYTRCVHIVLFCGIMSAITFVEVPIICSHSYYSFFLFHVLL